MELIDKALEEYCLQHTSPESPVLAQLNRDTHAQVLMPRMISGHLQGRTLALFSHMLRPRFILEIGTYTGYSAICLAEGLQPDGQLHTIDINDELQTMQHRFWQQAGIAQQVHLHLGDARQIIPTLPHTYDLAFIDADKTSYPTYWDLVIPRMRPGGVVIADNVLWSGKVTDAEAYAKDPELQVMMAFNTQVQADPRVENVLLPLRDGLMVARVL